MTEQTPPTWTERVNRALDRAAGPLSVQPGNIERSRAHLRNLLRHSVAFEPVKDLLLEFGNQPSAEIYKARAAHREAVELVERWEEGQL